MEQTDLPPNQGQDEPRFEVIPDIDGNTAIKGPDFSHTGPMWIPPTSAPGRSPITSDKIDNQTAESTTSLASKTTMPKKKGLASTVKKAPKRAKSKAGKTLGESTKGRPPAPGGGPDSEVESDHGPYCICRGPDDHRWMICCEKCEDWFHGECVNLDKEIGETLVERFICPNCSDGRRYVTRYKKMCSLAGCKKPARIYDVKDTSVFCSDEHGHQWWEKMVSSLPRKMDVPPSAGDTLTQEDFMALLSSTLGGVDESTGTWKLSKHPFIRQPGLVRQFTGKPDEEVRNGDIPLKYLSEEEELFVHASASDRYMLAEEIVQCKKMLQLLDMANDRHKAAVAAGRFSSDICGYDSRLDTVAVQAPFVAFTKTEEGKAIFKSGKLGDPTGSNDEDSLVRGMCEKKRCKPHHGWYNMLSRTVRAQIKNLAAQAKERLDEENDVKEAAEERFYRKKAEGNWVEVHDDDEGLADTRGTGLAGMDVDIE
ncbi:hypothetical protein jhhlp_004161 [Lomentospora prolificans]|uniref:PHD-type domain-containing protein n=1 Tax=Lomentospora prolificans TaxID=41688 RepID=A0A2N3NAU8_9PEZI|nr:hypothetical protein jhhlp_004161 [Lomentospora prolificans]